MKIQTLFIAGALSLSALCTCAQTNTFPLSGNVGIGTASPAVPLDVNGNGNYRGSLQIGNGMVNSNTTKLFINNSYGDGKNWVLSSGANMITEQGFHIYNWTDNPTSPLLTITNSGNVGIGTTGPNEKLQVDGNIYVVKAGGSKLYLANSNYLSYVASVENDGSSDLSLGANNTDCLRILGVNGNVGIGTTTPTEKLSVNGNIRAKEIKVETANWPDYVFSDTYQPSSLNELETYIKTNKHLPEIPSAKEAEENGISLGEMNAKLLKKIEELTLYILDQEKRIQKLEAKSN